MKIDHDYIKSLLEAFESSLKESLTISDMQRLGFNTDDAGFIFHLRLLQDGDLIAPVNPHDHNLGFSKNINNHIVLSPVQIRMTSSGFEYLAAIRQSKIMEKVKGFGSASLGVAVEIAKGLALEYARKAVGL